jgi:4-amino-4-deoxy-L-arabinose transferase-like glycosyltransferase
MKTEAALKTKYPWILISLLMVFYFVIIHKLVSKPLIGWEVLSWEHSIRVWQREFSAIDLFVHPTFFGYFGALNFKLFGLSEASLRITGIISFLGTLFLLPVLVRYLLARENYAFPASVAVILFALSPLAVQGSLANDITDTGLLVFATMVFFVVYYAFYNARMAKKILVLGVVYGFCLCTKVTTSLALPLSIFVFYCLKRNWREASILSLGIFAVGMLVFSISWLLNCFFIDRPAEFFTPFKYALSSFFGSTDQSNLGGLGQWLNWMLTAFRMGVWLTPFFIVLTLTAVVFQVRQFLTQKILYEENQLLVYAIIVFSVYALANATVEGGFPKYIAPIVPILCVYIGLTLHRLSAEDNISWIWGGVFAAGVLYYYYVVGDAIYPTFLIRKYSYTGAHGVFPMIALFALKELLFPLFLVIVVLMAKQYSARKLLLIIFVSFCAGNAATLVSQSKATYATGMAFGSEGAETVKQFNLKHGLIYVCREGVVAAGDKVIFIGIPAKTWKDAASFYSYMEQRRPQSFVYGLACNTIAQMRIMESSPTREYLDQNYHRTIAGDYVLCQRVKKIKEQ